MPSHQSKVLPENNNHNLHPLKKKYNYRQIMFQCMIEEAEKIRDKFMSLQSEKNVSPFHFAVIDAALGNEDAAIDSLYKSYDEHFGILVYLKASPLFEKLFDHPRFYELLRKIGLEK